MSDNSLIGVLYILNEKVYNVVMHSTMLGLAMQMTKSEGSLFESDFVQFFMSSKCLRVHTMQMLFCNYVMMLTMNSNLSWMWLKFCEFYKATEKFTYMTVEVSFKDSKVFASKLDAFVDLAGNTLSLAKSSHLMNLGHHVAMISSVSESKVGVTAMTHVSNNDNEFVEKLDMDSDIDNKPKSQGVSKIELMVDEDDLLVKAISSESSVNMENKLMPALELKKMINPEKFELLEIPDLDVAQKEKGYVGSNIQNFKAEDMVFDREDVEYALNTTKKGVLKVADVLTKKDGENK